MDKPSILAGAGLLVLFSLQACSDKTVTAPAAPAVAVKVAAPAAVVAPAAQAAPEPVAPAKFKKSANLQCQDRVIELNATCVNIWETSRLACTSQRLSFKDAIEGKELNAREFEVGKPDKDEPGLIDGNVQHISCVTTKSNEKYFVLMMSRSGGGNCEECEWVDVYSWDGLLAGTDGGGLGKSKIKAIEEATEAAFDSKLPPMAKIDLSGFYFDPTDQ